MEPENNTPKFKIPQLKGFANPLTSEGMRALAIVLAVLVVIAAAVLVANAAQKKESTVVPVILPPTIPTEIPTVAPLAEEGESPASPSPTRKVRESTGTATPAVSGVTATPTPAP